MTNATMNCKNTAVHRVFVETRSGLIHVACSGSGFPVLMLHQTPRSWDEYRDVLPILGQDYRAIAMDTVGFGDSQPLPAAQNSIEDWAAAAFDLLDALDIARAVIVGHHTGAVIALEMAASRPDRVAALGLSSMPLVDAAHRASHHGKRVIDDVEHRSGGDHLTELWLRRKPFYPEGDVDLLERFMVDALKAGPLAVAGHQVVNRYRMESRLPMIRCPTLVIAPTADPHVYSIAARIAQTIPGSTLIEMEDGMVPLPDQMPQRFAAVLEGFLKGVQLNCP